MHGCGGVSNVHCKQCAFALHLYRMADAFLPTVGPSGWVVASQHALRFHLMQVVRIAGGGCKVTSTLSRL